MGKGLLQINKIPATTENVVEKKSFIKLPKLYLELVENKNKIVPNLVNKEYDYSKDTAEKQKPISDILPISVRMDELLKIQPTPDAHIPRNKLVDEYTDPGYSSESNGSESSGSVGSVGSVLSVGSGYTSTDSSYSQQYPKNNPRILTHSPKLSPPSPFHLSTGEEFKQPRKFGINSPLNNYGTPVNNYKQRYSDDEKTQSPPISYQRQPSQSYKPYQPTQHNEPTQPTYQQSYQPYQPPHPHQPEPLYQPNNVAPYQHNRTEQTIPAPSLDFSFRDETRVEPPSLHELNMNQTTIPNLNNFKSDEEQDDLKRELLFKFELLKKSYKDASIPEFSMHSDYHSMKQSYDRTLKRLSIESSVDNYKTYLIGGFMLVEYGLGNYMGFDMKGFTQQQIVSMTQYERLLLELGEKSYVEEESQWPVELRLFGLIIMQAVFFVVSKLIAKKTGSNLLNMINSMNNHASNQEKAKKRMRGPSINLDELPTVG